MNYNRKYNIQLEHKMLKIINQIINNSKVVKKNKN
jgi:hypothetical protein